MCDTHGSHASDKKDGRVKTIEDNALLSPKMRYKNEQQKEKVDRLSLESLPAARRQNNDNVNKRAFRRECGLTIGRNCVRIV